MVTDRDKAFIGAILVFLTWFASQYGIELTEEVKGALETLLTWGLPAAASLLSGIIIFYTRNKPQWKIVRDKEQPVEVLPYRDPPGK